MAVMRRSTWLTVALVAFIMILATFVVRGTTRLLIGDRYAMLLSLPIAILAGSIVVTVLLIALGDRIGVLTLVDDLDSSDER